MSDQMQTQVKVPSATATTFRFRKPTAESVKQAVEAGRAPPIARAPVDIEVPKITVEELTNILVAGTETPDIGGAALKLVLEALDAVVNSAVREQLDEQEASKEIDVTLVDLSKCTLQYIASLPPAKRGKSSISEEAYEAWADDFVAFYVEAGQSEEKMRNLADIYVRRLSTFRKAEAQLKNLHTNLLKWFLDSKTPALFTAQYDAFNTKINGYLAALATARDETSLM